MLSRLISGVCKLFRSNSMPCRTHVDLDLQRWDCREVSHAHQVVGCAGEAEDPVHFAHSARPQFAQPGDRLQPAETLFDALSLLLTETIAGMLCLAPVDCAPTAPCQVLRHMGCHSQMSTLGHEIPSVEALISAYGHRLRSRNLLQHHQRRIALCPSVGHEHFCGDDQSVAILDQQIPAVAQLGLLPITFARRSDGCRFVPCVPKDQALIPTSTAAARSVPIPPRLFTHLPTLTPTTLTTVIRNRAQRTAGKATRGLSITSRARGPPTYKPIPSRYSRTKGM